MDDYAPNEEILSSIKTEESSTPAVAETTTPDASKEAAAPAQPDYKTLEYEYTVEGGKKVKENLEMILKRAGLGYHYAQRAQGLNQKETEWGAKESEWTKKDSEYQAKLSALSKWQEIDDYAKSNPDWAKHVEESWNGRTQGVQSNVDPTISTKLQELQSKLDDVSGWKQSFEAEKQRQVQAQEDQEYLAETEKIAKEFGVDLSLPDENGASLEWRVLEHMKKMGLNGKPGHFAMAFKDYYWPNLVKMKEDQAREAVVKDGQTLRRNGIIEKKSTPSRPIGPPADIRNHSWDQLMEMAKQDKTIFPAS